MELLCREAAMKPVRRLMTKLEQISLPPPQATNGRLKQQVRGVITEPAVNVESLLRSDPVTQDDILETLKSTKRSSDGNMERYEVNMIYFW
jgi:SpoVK/Ycf46/Vps4 family AAA+-type ATPase